MNTTTYTISTIFSMVFVTIILIAILAIVIYYIVKKRVALSTAQAMRANVIMKHAIDMSDHLIVVLDLKDDTFINIHDARLQQGEAKNMTIEKALKHIHPNYRKAYLQSIESMRKGERSENTLTYTYNTSDDTEHPQWTTVHNHCVVEYDHNGKPAYIIFIMRDEADETRLRQQNNEMADKYQMLFEESIIGISFYNADGYLIDCNKKMREICHFQSRYDTVFFESTLFDTAQFDINRDHPEEIWLCEHFTLPKRNINKFVEIHIHPMQDEKGKLQYIAMTVRDVTGDRELYMQNRRNNLQIQKANDAIHRYEEQLRYLLENSKMHVWRTSFEKRDVEILSDLHTTVAKMTVEEFAQKIQTDEYEGAIRRMTERMENRKDPRRITTRPFKNLLDQDDKVHWYNMNSIPSYDSEGRQTGYFGLIRDVTQLMEEQEMLKRETERANDSDRMKSVFLANMTHEIRTPLNAIVGFSDLLTSIDSPDDRLEMMRIIRNNCDMLLRLINDFLALSSIESNGLVITPTDIDFAHEFNDFCQSLAQRVTDSNISFICDNPYEELHTCLDKERIGQVVTNFVTNAVKYTQQGHIKMGYRIENNGLYIYCEDTGTGIPKEDCERIFERFVKLNDYIQGTGLGLSICKAIVDKCNGRIGVDSEPGQGSLFWFWIPCEIKEVKQK